MDIKDEGEFKRISFNELIIDNDGKAGISFETLRSEFGFSINIKGAKVYIKEGGKDVNTKSTEESRSGKLISNDDFELDAKILKEHFYFQDYYQKSLIYSSEKRGLKHYDILISQTSHCYNITIKGNYEEGCALLNSNNVIPKIIMFYFPIGYEDLIVDILGEKNIRCEYDNRDVLVRDYDINTKEIVFSKIGGNLG
ncbi:MAG: hypothetical protein RR891_10560 [Clostridium sp.]|uniref:hypothetical protein n=1 Tax=Clostridium sp. TaxID=1506 RepID=UPI00302E0036